MPTTVEAVKCFKDNSILHAPGKASNAGGVSTSGMEMGQNALFLYYSAQEVDNKLKGIMENIFKNVSNAAEVYGDSSIDYVSGANAAGFLTVANAMIMQGCV